MRSKSIYKEALEKIDVGFDTWERADRFEFVRHALKQAQKQEELLELYRELMTVKDGFSFLVIPDGNYYVNREKEANLEKQIKELENE